LEVDTVSSIVIGCAELPFGANASQYFARVPYLESTALFERLPKPKAWQRIRDDAALGTFGLVAPAILTHHRASPASQGFAVPAATRAALGHLVDHPFSREVVADFAKRAAAISARAVVFATPSDFTPSAANRARLEHFFTHLATAELFGSALRVWRPDGLWEASTVVALANTVGIVPCLDPLAVAPGQHVEEFAQLPLAHAYFRVTGFGLRGRLRPGNVETLVAVAGAFPAAHLVFATETAFIDARSALEAIADNAS